MRRTPQPRAGWVIACGAALCALLAVAPLPYVPTTAVAQILAAVGQRPEWSRAAAFGRPAPALARALAAAPADAVLHLGAAAWERSADEMAQAEEPAWCGNSYRHDTFQARGLAFRDPERRLAPPSGIDGVRRELAQLFALGNRFPNDPAVRAYQLRCLLRGPVWIPDASPYTLPGKNPPSPQLLQQFDSIARAGQRLEPTNGFFDAMRAVAAFAGRRDDMGLRYLHLAAAKQSWDDHAIDETRAVWRLLHAAYGDRGVEQLLPSKETLLFPHLAVLWLMARVTVMHAAAFDRAGAHSRAREVRTDLMRLGLHLEDRSLSLIGRQMGGSIFYLTMAPATPKAVAHELLRTNDESVQRLERHAAGLEADGDFVQAAWVRACGRRVDVMQRRARRARDARSPGVPFWPPTGLAFWWELGVVLLQQIGVTLVVWGAVLLLPVRLGRKKREVAAPAACIGLPNRPPRLDQWAAAYGMLLLAPLTASMALRGGATLVWQESVIAGLAMAGMLAIVQSGAQFRRRRTGAADPQDGGAQRLWGSALAALLSVALPIGLMAPFLMVVSYTTQGGSIYGLPGWGPPLALTCPEVAFLPAMLIGCFAFCRGAERGLPPAAGLRHGVRQTAPYALLLLLALYLASVVPASRANATATRQMERTLLNPFAAIETPNDQPSIDLALEP